MFTLGSSSNDHFVSPAGRRGIGMQEHVWPPLQSDVSQRTHCERLVACAVRSAMLITVSRLTSRHPSSEDQQDMTRAFLGGRLSAYTSWVNERLRAARLAAGLSQEQLAERVNAVVVPAGALDRNAVARTERGDIRRPSRRYRDGYAMVLGDNTLFDPQPEALDYALTRPERVDHAALNNLAEMLTSARKLEDTAGTHAVLRTIEHTRAIAEIFAREAKLAVRPHALELLNEFSTYLGWLRFSAKDHTGSAIMLDTALSIGIEANSDVGVADALSFKGYTNLERGFAVPAASIIQAVNRYTHGPADRTYYNLLEARCLAAAGESYIEALKEADKTFNKADQDTLTTRNYWYSEAFLTVERGLVFAAAGQLKQAQRDIADGLANMPDEFTQAPWAKKYWNKLEEL